MHRPLNIAVLGSGRGSNFQAIVSAMQARTIPGASIAVVISNNSAAGILQLARVHAIEALHISERQFSTAEDFANHLLATLHDHGVNLIVLAGYMKRVPPNIVEEYRNRIINIHPALLPKFGGQGMYGMHVHEAVIAAKEQFSGATVHIVDEEYDRGKILLQRRVAVDAHDTAASLAQKVLAIEHEIYPEAIRMIAAGSTIVSW